MELSKLSPFTFIVLVAILIAIVMVVILSILTYFFPNSKVTKFVKKVGEWLQDGIQGL